MVEFDIHNLQKIKLGVHIAQSTLILVAWCLEIATFHNAKSIDGRPGWYFGLCFLTVPAIIYLTMVHRFPRTRKWANPYALVSIDLIYAIFWISAFAAQASYNSSGKCKGACGVSKGVVGFGVFIWLLWCLTTAMSLYGLAYYKREGYLPGASRAPFNAQAIDPDKEAFSTAPHDDEYVPVHNAEEHEIPDYEGGSSYTGAGLGVNTSSMGSRHDNAYGGYTPPGLHENTGYTGYTTTAPPAASVDGRVRFPDGRYDV
jgi:hypothetical protein